MKRRLNRPNKPSRPGRPRRFSKTGVVAAAGVFTSTTAAALVAACPVTFSVTVATEPRTVVVGQQDVQAPLQRPVCTPT